MTDEELYEQFGEAVTNAAGAKREAERSACTSRNADCSLAATIERVKKCARVGSNIRKRIVHLNDKRVIQFQYVETDVIAIDVYGADGSHLGQWQ